MSKNIILFGATGSIGSSVLKILDKSNGEFCLKGITCNQNIDSLIEISNQYNCHDLGVSNKDISTLPQSISFCALLFLWLILYLRQNYHYQILFF